MSATAIHAWLATNGAFHIGVALLREQGGVDPVLAFLLDLGETSVSRARLTAALRAVHEAALRNTLASPDLSGKPLVTRADRHASDQGLAKVPLDGFQDTELPSQLAELRVSIREHLREMDYLRNRLDTLPSDQDRFRDALRIVDLDDRVVSAYARLDAWKVSGVDPGEQPKPSQRSGAALQRELQNIRSYLARHRSGKRPAPPTCVTQWEQRLAEVQQLIDALP
jgi:hypothetical protein